jgi:hypothetical protein
MAHHVMDSRVILVVAMIGLALGCSCSKTDQSLEEKRQNAIQVIRQYHSATKNPVQAKFARDVLAALNLANVATLKKPLVATAVIVQDEKQACRFYLLWIEDFPSIDAVEFKYGVNPPIIFQIPDADLETNLSESKRTVVFTTGYNWGSGTDFAENMSRSPARMISVLGFSAAENQLQIGRL